MEPKRRSSRLGKSHVNYSESNPRRPVDDKGKAPAEAAADEDDSSSEEEEEAPVVRPKSKKQKAAGRPAGSTNGAEGEEHNRADDDEGVHGDEPGPSKRKRQRVAAPSAADVKDLTLFEIVWKQGSAIPYASHQWLEHYKTDRADATAQAMTLLLQAGGCDRTINTDDVEDGNADDIVKEFAEVVKKEGATDPFHKASKSFPSNYVKLWDKLVQEVYNADLLQDNFIMEKISNFVIAMSVSPIRSFRYAATLTASQLVSSWVHTLLALSEAQNTANQQLEVERKKKSTKVVQERINMLSKNVEKKRRAVSEVQALVNNLMDAVFAHRFRDVDMDIRALVIKGIASWIHLHPPMFLADQYLKYVAWGMSDKDKVVRAAAIDGLLKLYGVEENVLPLREFTKRFTGRFMELPYDIDIDVAVRGAKLLDKLVAVKQLDRSNVRDLYRLLADDSPELRHAAADVVVRLLENAASTDAQGDAAAKGKATTSATDMNKAQVQLLNLLKIMSQLADPKPATAAPAGPSTSAATPAIEPLDDATITGVVDALYDRLPILHDWNVLCVALMEDRLATLRGSIGDIHLARVVRASVRLQTAKASNKKPKGRGVRAAKESAEAAANSLQTMSLVLMQQLPRLLQKYSTNGEVVSSLLDIITDIQLEVYSLKQKEKDLEELTQQVSELLLKHSHKAALTSAASVLLYLAEKSPTSLQDATQLVLSEALDTTGSKLAEAYRAAKAVPDEELQDAVEEASQGGQGNSQLFNLHLALTRVNVLQAQGSEALGSRTEVFDTLEEILHDAGQGRNYGAAVIGATATALLMALMWKLRRIMGTAATQEADSMLASVKELVAARNSVLSKLMDIFKAVEDTSVKDAVFTVAVDLMLVLGSRNAWVNTPLDDADVIVSDDAVRTCWEHCLEVLERHTQSEPTEEGSPDETQEEQPTKASTSPRVAAVAGVGRLLAFAVLADSQMRWLGALYVALMGGRGKAVTEVVKDVCRHIRKNKPGLLPDMYLSAMKTSFTAALMTAEDGEEADEAVMQDFSSLCEAIASTYAGHNISKGPLLHICEGGVEFVLEDVPKRLPFLEWGLAHFTLKLQAEAAEQLLEELEEGVAGVERRLEDMEWSSYDLYTKGLKERANSARVTTRGVLKQPLTLQPTVDKMARRISFAGDEEVPQGQAAGTRASPVAEAHDEHHDEQTHDDTQGESGDAMEEDDHQPTSASHQEEDNDNQQEEDDDNTNADDEGTPEVQHAAVADKRVAGRKRQQASSAEEGEEQVQNGKRQTRTSGKAKKMSSPAQRSSKRARKSKDVPEDVEEEDDAIEAEAVTVDHTTANTLEASSSESEQEEEEAPPKRGRKKEKMSFAIMAPPPVDPNDHEQVTPEVHTDDFPTQQVTVATQDTAAPSASEAAPSSAAIPSSEMPTQDPSHEAMPSSENPTQDPTQDLTPDPTQDLNLEASLEASQEPSRPTRGKRGGGGGKAEGGAPVSRRVTRAASQEGAGSQQEAAGNVRAGKGRGRKQSVSQPSTEQGGVEESQAASLDSLQGMMPTEEQLPFARQEPLSMSNPEALPQLPESEQQATGDDEAEGHARRMTKRRRRR